MKFEPILDRIVVEKMERKNVSKGGIILPKSQEDDRNIPGKVIAVGPGRHDNNGLLLPMQIKEGDLVVFDSVTAYPINIAGTTVYTMREHEIFVILKDNDKT